MLRLGYISWCQEGDRCYCCWKGTYNQDISSIRQFLTVLCGQFGGGMEKRVKRSNLVSWICKLNLGSFVFWWLFLMIFSSGVTLFRKSYSMHSFNTLIQMYVWKSYIRYNYLSLATLQPWIPITQFLMVLVKARNWNGLWLKQYGFFCFKNVPIIALSKM